MVTMNTNIISVSVDDEIKKHISKNIEIESLSQWFRETYRSEFMELSSLTKEIEHYSKIIEEKKKRIKQLKSEKKTIKTEIPKAAISWLKSDGLFRLRKYSEEGVYKFFVNKFNLHKSMNRRKFKLIVEALK